jgi:hypothetical protein
MCAKYAWTAWSKKNANENGNATKADRVVDIMDRENAMLCISIMPPRWKCCNIIYVIPSAHSSFRSLAASNGIRQWEYVKVAITIAMMRM